MQPSRDPDLQRLLDLTEQAILTGAEQLPSAAPVTRQIFSAMRNVGAAASRPELPETAAGVVGAHLASALAVAGDGPPPVAELAALVARLAPRFGWYRRPHGDGDEPGFQDRHANAVIVGEAGLETRADVRIGLSLVAPGTTYPDHRHPPEEVYVVLSPGAWRQDQNPWLHRQPGEIVHNPPGIWHAMQAGRDPLLAIWCLWMR